MSVSSHVEQLRRKHQDLEDRISKELQSPGSDDLQIAQLKKEKLHLKEEISRLTE